MMLRQLQMSVRSIWLDDEPDECPLPQQPLKRAIAGETVRRQMIRFNTASFDGTVLTWGRSAQALHGHPAEEGVGLSFSALFAAVEAVEDPGPAGLLAAALAAGSVRTDGLRRRRDGSTFWAEGMLTLLRDEVGAPTGFVEVAHDVTEKHQAEQEIRSLNERLRTLNLELESRIRDRTEQLVRQTADLRATNAELESFSYSVSHNLRAPLRAVAGYARLIEERFGGQFPAEAVAYLHKLNESAATMGKLIDGLLSLLRTQRTNLMFERLDLADLVQECREALAEQWQGRVVTLTVGSLPTAEGIGG